MSSLTFLAYLQINNANRNISLLIEQNNRKTELYYEMRNASRDRIISLHAMLETDDPFVHDSEWIRHSGLAGIFIASQEMLQELPLDNEESKLLEDLNRTLRVTQPIQTRLVDHVLAGEHEKAITLLPSASEAQRASLVYIDRLVEAQKIRNKTNLEDAHSAYHNTVQYLVLIAVSILVFGSVIALYLRNKVGHAANSLLAINRTLQATNYELEEARNASDSANKAKSDFLANMSHEIRTPMNAILSVIGILRSGKVGGLDDKGNQMLDMAHRNSEHLLVLINDLLDSTEIEAGNIKFSTEPVDIRKELNSVVESLTHDIKKKGLRLSHRASSEIAQYVILDPARLYQLLINFISNAIKYTDKGSIKVDIRLISIANQAYIHFDIVDTGVGIPKERHDQVFEKFYQADATSTREYGGAGLGLAICKRLIEAMSGNVGLESIPGEGSVFWFNLPYEKSTIRD